MAYILSEYWRLIHPDERQTVARIVSRRINGQEAPQSYEMRRLRKDGQVIWCEMMASHIEYGGKPAIMGNIIDVSERKGAEEELCRSRDYLDRILNGIYEGLMVVDRDFTIIDVNKGFLKQYGDRREDVIGRKCYKVTHGTDKPCSGTGDTCPAREVFATGKPMRTEHIRLDYRGQERVFDINVFGLFGEDGNVEFVVELRNDITGRKQAEEALRESEGKYRTLFEGAADAILLVKVSVGQGARFLDCNSRALEMFGCTREQLIGKSPEDFSPPTQPDGMPTHEKVLEIAKATAQGKPQFFEWAHRRLDGTSFPAEVTLNYIEIHGETYIQAVTRDITERKRVEEELREGENRHRTLLENLPQKIFLKDRNSVYLSCNDNYAWDLKIKPEEIVGKTDYDFYPKALAEKYRADDKRIMASGKTEEIEEKYIADGQEIIVQTVKTPVKDAEGNTSGVLGIFWDITERKRAGEELSRSRDYLDRILNGMYEGLMVVDRDFTIRDCSVENIEP